MMQAASDVKTHKYQFGEMVSYLASAYFPGIFILIAFVRPEIRFDGVQSYITFVSVAAVVFGAIAYIDHMPGRTIPTSIRIKNRTVILSRLWVYQTFDLSDVVEIGGEIKSPFARHYCGMTKIVYKSDGVNRQIYVSPGISDFLELLKTLGSGEVLVYDSNSNTDQAVFFVRRADIINSRLVPIAFVVITVVFLINPPPWLCFLPILFGLLASISPIFSNPISVQFEERAIICKMLYWSRIRVPYADILDIQETPKGMRIRRKIGFCLIITPQFEQYTVLAKRLLDIKKPQS